MSWDSLVDELLADLPRKDPRTQAYWAQQLAFGPVFVHALRLRLRAEPLSPDDGRLLAETVRLAKSALGALPERSGVEPAALHLLARRQARAATWGRRGCLARLLATLGYPDSEPSIAPPRMARAYPVLGWRPDERLQG